MSEISMLQMEELQGAYPVRTKITINDGTPCWSLMLIIEDENDVSAEGLRRDFAAGEFDVFDIIGTSTDGARVTMIQGGTTEKLTGKELFQIDFDGLWDPQTAVIVVEFEDLV